PPPSTSTPSLHDALPIFKEVGNDPRMAYLEKETAVIRFGSEGKRAAKRLAQQVDGAQMQKDDRSTKTVSLVLGSKWDGLKPKSEDRKSTRLNSSHVSISY